MQEYTETLGLTTLRSVADPPSALSKCPVTVFKVLSHLFLIPFFPLLRHSNLSHIPLECIFSHDKKSRNQVCKGTEIVSLISCFDIQRIEAAERHPPHHLGPVSESTLNQLELKLWVAKV